MIILWQCQQVLNMFGGCVNWWQLNTWKVEDIQLQLMCKLVTSCKILTNCWLQQNRSSIHIAFRYHITKQYGPSLMWPKEVRLNFTPTSHEQTNSNGAQIVPIFRKFNSVLVQNRFLAWNSLSTFFLTSLRAPGWFQLSYTCRCKFHLSLLVYYLIQSNFYAMMKQKPEIVLSAAHLLVKRLSPFVRQIDFALDWVQIESGRAIYKKGKKFLVYCCICM